MRSERTFENESAVKTLSREKARRVYNRLGTLLDSQSFYENRALDLIIQNGQFASARNMFEFGCGTGRFGLRLLSEHLPSDAVYRAVDLSPTMVRLAEDRLAVFSSRAKVSLSDGSPPAQEPSEFYDRFVSTYVLDLLSDQDIALVLREAHRMLEPGGLLCLSSLSTGSGFASRMVARLWTAVHKLGPSLVGGCRPIELAGVLSSSEWRLRYHAHVAPFAIPSEVVVADRL
ncbi:MAG: class I SAM-dependent methyltransferase [Rhodothermia bacterium]|nr:MAG: class I SAM-dependent methyltransferase [Rhodothermia bacterium]